MLSYTAAGEGLKGFEKMVQSLKDRLYTEPVEEDTVHYSLREEERRIHVLLPKYSMWQKPVILSNGEKNIQEHYRS